MDIETDTISLSMLTETKCSLLTLAIFYLSRSFQSCCSKSDDMIFKKYLNYSSILSLLLLILIQRPASNPYSSNYSSLLFIKLMIVDLIHLQIKYKFNTNSIKKSVNKLIIKRIMGQSPQANSQINLPPQFLDYLYSPQTHVFYHPQTNNKIYYQEFKFRGLTNRHFIDNYYRTRKQLSDNKADHQLLKLLDYKIIENPIKNNQQTSTFKNLTERNLCTHSARNTSKQEFAVALIFQISEINLEDQIYNRIGKKGFEEIQLWSVLSSCVLGAMNLLEQGLKEPVLSPRAIGLTKQGVVKVGQWQLLPQKYSEKNCAQEDGQLIIGETIHSKDHLTEILMGFYWPPEGIKAMEEITNLGRKRQNSRPIETFKKMSKFQIFSLGMTLISMCLRNCFYRIQTYSQKYLDKLIHQAIEIRKVQGKPLSLAMEKVLTSLVKWDPQDRINYFDLKNLIIEYFSSHSGEQSLEGTINCSASLSFSHISESMSEQISKHEISISKSAMNKVFISEINEENKKIAIPLSKIKNSMTAESSFGENIFGGSGTIDQGEGDEYLPEEQPEIYISQGHSLQKSEVRKSIEAKKYASNASSCSSRSQQSNRLKSSVMNYKNSQSGSGHESKNSPMLVGDQVRPSNHDFEDAIEKPIQHFYDNSPQSQGPDLFEEFYESSSAQQSIVNEQYGLSTERTFKKDERLNDFSQSPYFPQQCNHNQRHTHQNVNFYVETQDQPLYENSQEIGEILQQEQNIFTDPKLLQYIRSPINSLQSSLDKPLNSELANNVDNNKRNLFPRENHVHEKNVCHERFTHMNKENQHNNWILVENDSGNVSSNSRKLVTESTHRLVKQEMSRGFYEGEKKNGIRSGYGVFYYNEGGKYKGNWINNKMHGKGTLEYADGRIAYQGQWNSDQLHGLGILYNESPRNIDQQLDFHDLNNLDEYWVYYDGQFEFDDKSGKGMLVMTNGEQFIGEFRNDVAWGHGQYYKMDGSVVKGVWEDNHLMHNS